MSAPESRPDIESALADAFARRHERQRLSRPSVVDVRRRAHRQASRRATARAGAVVVAGATVVAGGWVATRGSSSPSPSAVPADLPGTPVETTAVENPDATAVGTPVVTTAGSDPVARVLGPSCEAPLIPGGLGRCLLRLTEDETFYQVVEGDTLASVAERFCTTAQALAEANLTSDVDAPLEPLWLLAVPTDAC